MGDSPMRQSTVEQKQSWLGINLLSPNFTLQMHNRLFQNIGTAFIHLVKVLHVSEERNSALKALRNSENYTIHH